MQIKFSALTVLRFGDASRPEWQPRYHSQALGSKMQSPVETMLRVLQYARVEAEVECDDSVLDLLQRG